MDAPERTRTETDLIEYICGYFCDACRAKFPIFHTATPLGKWSHGQNHPCDAARVRNAYWAYQLRPRED